MKIQSLHLQIKTEKTVEITYHRSDGIQQPYNYWLYIASGHNYKFHIWSSDDFIFIFEVEKLNV